MLLRRIDEFDRALFRMSDWADAWSRTIVADTASIAPGDDGVRAFEQWHGAYHAAMAALFLCDACGQLRLDDSHLETSYATWKYAHQALYEALDVGPSAEMREMREMSEMRLPTCDLRKGTGIPLENA